MSDEIELGGVAEISKEFGVARSTISMWNSRKVAGFPEPLTRLDSGPIYDMAEIRKWWHARQPTKKSPA